MRAYLINPFDQTVSEIVYDGNYQTIYKLIDAQTFDAVRLNRERDSVFIDDEGLFMEEQKFFTIAGYPQPLGGKGLVLGCDSEGESIAPAMTLEALKGMVTFRPDLRFEGFAPPQEYKDPKGGFVVDMGKPMFSTKKEEES